MTTHLNLTYKCTTGAQQADGRREEDNLLSPEPGQAKLQSRDPGPGPVRGCYSQHLAGGYTVRWSGGGPPRTAGLAPSCRCGPGAQAGEMRSRWLRPPVQALRVGHDSEAAVLQVWSWVWHHQHHLGSCWVQSPGGGAALCAVMSLPDGSSH